MSLLSSARRRLRYLTLTGAFVFLPSQASFVQAALPEDAPIVVSEPNSTRAIFSTGPRSRTGPLLLVIPVGSQVTLYVTNLDLMKGEGASAFRSDLQDVNGYRYPLDIAA